MVKNKSANYDNKLRKQKENKKEKRNNYKKKKNLNKIFFLFLKF